MTVMGTTREKIEAGVAIAAVLAGGAATYVSMSSAAVAEEKVAPVEKRVVELEKKQATNDAVLPRIDKALDEIKAEQRAMRDATDQILRELARRRRENGGR